MVPRRRRELTRLAAPTAFLAAATVAVLLIKAGLNAGGGGTTGVVPTVQPPTTTARARPRPTTRQTPTTARYYTVQRGDTLGGIAVQQHTSVDALLRLNPGIDPRALHSGQRIRVG